MKEKTLPVIEFFSREVLRRGEDLPARSSINSRIGQFMDPAKRHTIIARGEVSLARPRCARGGEWPELLAEPAPSASGFYLLDRACLVCRTRGHSSLTGGLPAGLPLWPGLNGFRFG